MNIEEIEKDIAQWKMHGVWCRSYYPTHVGDRLIQQIKKMKGDGLSILYHKALIDLSKSETRVKDLEADLATQIKYKLEAFERNGQLELKIKELESDREAWKLSAKIASKNEIQSCGHRMQFIYTEDGGKTIHCMACQKKELEEGIRKYHDWHEDKTGCEYYTEVDLYKLIEKGKE